VGVNSGGGCREQWFRREPGGGCARCKIPQPAHGASDQAGVPKLRLFCGTSWSVAARTSGVTDARNGRGRFPRVRCQRILPILPAPALLFRIHGRRQYDVGALLPRPGAAPIASNAPLLFDSRRSFLVAENRGTYVRSAGWRPGALSFAVAHIPRLAMCAQPSRILTNSAASASSHALTVSQT
jgi:hypothetical protein